MNGTQLTPEQKRQLIQILREIVRHASLEALAVATRTGESVAFYSNRESDADLFSALTAAVSNTANMVTEGMTTGKLYEVVVRGEDGYTIFSNAGDYILVGASRDVHSLGLAIRVLRRSARRLHDALSRRTSDLEPLIADIERLIK